MDAIDWERRGLMDFVKGFELPKVYEIIKKLNLHRFVRLKDINMLDLSLRLKFISQKLFRIHIKRWYTTIVWDYVDGFKLGYFIKDFYGTI